MSEAQASSTPREPKSIPVREKEPAVIKSIQEPDSGLKADAEKMIAPTAPADQLVHESEP